MTCLDMPPLKVFLVEDSLIVRDALSRILARIGGVQIVGGAEDERTALELMQDRRPDVAIVDLKLRSGSGIGVLKALSRDPDRFGRPRAVVFSNHSHRLARERWLALGVERIFDKATQIDELLAYIRQTVPS
ncbi:MAG TPA: response regulator transcription factor [Rhodocyclaceae bacterium]|nr:response regulator transcription factor [Rhodocyclaceae bacterium]